MRKSNHTYSIEQLQEAVTNSISIRGCLLYLNLNAVGNAYTVIKRRIKANNIDISHFKGQGWSKGTNTKSFTKIPLEDILEGKHPQYGTYKLKNRLIKANLLDYICSSCEHSTWMGHLIPLELDHIDGNPNNHKLENLRLLCPNCHALTTTHAGKNKRNNGTITRTRTGTPLTGNDF